MQPFERWLWAEGGFSLGTAVQYTTAVRPYFRYLAASAIPWDPFPESEAEVYAERLSSSRRVVFQSALKVYRRWREQHEPVETPFPTPKTPRRTAPCVYVVYVKDSHCVKIGHSEHLKHRLAQLRSATPSVILVLKVVPCETRVEARRLERELRRQFHAHHVTGEWFRYAGEVAATYSLDAESVPMTPPPDAEFEPV